ncbi:hypothetical protein AWH63_10075 [Marinobacter sp. C18]|uniref:thermonuclease family protein n=1 Tax=Marinobacter sp. C18 TaxID=1772288 RepID=UPI000948C388|nr:thermonuclease family protein [Marinobacter sp. C18]OLF81881.1 hypothetical protein AWH63_10075 [Marinobacter sp. C18]
MRTAKHSTKISDPIWGLVVSLFVVLFGTEQASADYGQPIVAKGRIVHVTDGDTASVELSAEVVREAKTRAQEAEKRYQRDMNLSSIYTSSVMRIRVANIDTAESVHPDASKNSMEGMKASRFARETFAGDAVIVYCFEVGYYGRPICDIRSNDGDWAETMIRAGYSKYITKWGRHPNTKRHQALSTAQQQTF